MGMVFTPEELAYLRAADLGRLATIKRSGSPQVSPVGFTYNDELTTIDVGGYRMSDSQKFRNVASNPKVAFVVDDIASHDPWRVRCVEIRGTAEQVFPSVDRDTETDGAGDVDGALIRITPRRIISFGIGDTTTEAHNLAVDRRNVHPR